MTNRPGAPSRPSPWVMLPKPNPDARLRLFCFPYAGAGASMYKAWVSLLPHEVEVVAVQLPGRESRMRERPFNDLRALTAALGEALVPFMDRPFAFFGHSNGGLMAFELTRLLRRQGRALPLHLAASGRPAPQVDLQAPTTYDLPDAEFVEMLRRFNGTPEEVLANEELMALMTPILRADFALGETYVYTPEPPLALPISAFGGRMDAEVPAWTVDAWREQAAASFRAVMFAGGHFFVHENLHHVVGELTADLRRAMNAAGGHAGSADG